MIDFHFVFIDLFISQHYKEDKPNHKMGMNSKVISLNIQDFKMHENPEREFFYFYFEFLFYFVPLEKQHGN